MSTPILGAGLCPAGLAFAGYGTPATHYQPNLKLQGPSDRIDPETRDFVMDPINGVYQGMSSAEEMVFFCLATLRGSSVVTELGHTFNQLNLVTNSLPDLYRAKVNEALAEPLKLNIITILSIDVTVQGTRLLGQVRWRDNTTAKTHTSSI